MDLDLADRVILVVGGTGLIGSAIAARLSSEGAVAVTASRHAGASDIEMDGTSDESVEAGIAAGLARYGRLDGVVVSAAPAAGTLDPARSSEPAEVSEAMNRKAMVFLRIANAVLPGMVDAGYGRIVGVSGQNAWLSGNIAGAVRNAALNIVAKSLADGAAGSGVAVNTVNPGPVVATRTVPPDRGRAGESTPAQIADLVAYLVSPLCALSGENLAVGHRVRGVLS